MDAEHSHHHISFISKRAGGFNQYRKTGEEWKAKVVMIKAKGTRGNVQFDVLEL
jgi:hypothetical protein